MVGMAATADGRGYWLVSADGGVFALGDARYYGNMSATRLNKPIVGMAATADGRGTGWSPPMGASLGSGTPVTTAT